MLNAVKTFVISLFLLANLAACSSGGADYATQCMFEVNAPGAYEYPAGQAVPVVSPGVGGTAEGAAAVNACIQNKAQLAASTPAGSTQKAVVETETVDGRQYTVQTYTYGTPPAAAQAAPVVVTPAYRAPARLVSPGCTLGNPRIYRGSLYC
ncbi:hypothetical protein R5H30_13835 [Sulfitobacter sp. D35]|uniref:hypothetical protein n=1 Tax=Sulfitobacter sp. D35 TaxID=3083252 RepID=UPI00296EBE0E|nr:hypothetical protein [Sulfitobacter sp. D35]MDW4499072.1 hypothetical protein [Sulfitobacter sp. D35]